MGGEGDSRARVPGGGGVGLKSRGAVGLKSRGGRRAIVPGGGSRAIVPGGGSRATVPTLCKDSLH